MSEILGISFDPGRSRESKKFQVEEPLITQSQPQVSTKWDTQSLMGSIKDYVLGQPQFEGGSSDANDAPSEKSLTPRVHGNTNSGSFSFQEKSEKYEKSKITVTFGQDSLVQNSMVESESGDDDRDDQQQFIGFMGYQQNENNDDNNEVNIMKESKDETKEDEHKQNIHIQNFKDVQTEIQLEAYEDHCIFEPNSKRQWLHMIWMNGFEIFFVIIIGSLAIYQASWVTSVCYFISGYQFKAAKNFTPVRMLKRQRNCYVMIVLLSLDIVFKIIVIVTASNRNHQESRQYLLSDQRLYQSIGLSCVLEPKVSPTKIKFDHVKTFLFEICFIIILYLYYAITIRTERMILYLHQNKYKAKELIELEQQERFEREKSMKKKNVYQQDDEKMLEELQNSELNIKKENTQEFDQYEELSIFNYHKNDRKLEKQEQDREDLNKKKEKLKEYRNYIECETFKKSNKWLYQCVLISTVIQAMIFNSMVDITSLFLILIVKSFYSYREYYKTTYDRLVFFTCYWLQFITQLKIQFVIQMYIPQINYWFLNKLDQNNNAVKFTKSFFGLNFIVDHQRSATEQIVVILYYFSLFVCLFSSQMWKQCKWAQIRDVWIKEYQSKIKRDVIVIKNKNKQKANQKLDMYGNSWQMFEYYIFHKMQSKNDKKREEIIKNQMEVRKKMQENHDLKKAGNKENRYDQTEAEREQQYKSLKRKYQLNQKDFDSILPTLLIQLARILVTFQSYMYHTTLSQINLIWVILTFLISNQLSLFISIMFMIPLYLCEFIIIYAKQIPYLKAEIDSYCLRLNIFTWDLKAPVMEQILFYIILTTFVMMISALKMSIKMEEQSYGVNVHYINYYKKKLVSHHSSILWKISLYPIKRIQILIFVILFLEGTGFFAHGKIEQENMRLDHFKNLGYIFFFAIYVTFDRIYRQTSIILVYFVSFFILGQYFYSLNYHQFIKDEGLNNDCLWLGLWFKNMKPDWKNSDSVYFRQGPDLQMWTLLIVFKFLNTINVLFKDQGQVTKLETNCYQSLRQNYPSVISNYNNFKNLLQNVILYFYILIMIFYMTGIQLNALSILLVTQNIALIGLICKQEQSVINISWQLSLTQSMKIVACVIIMLDTLYLAFQRIFDNFLKAKAPKIYENLNFIGLRETDELHLYTKAQIEDKIHQKFYQYILYLIMSILIHSYFELLYSQQISEENWSADQYKKLYEFTNIQSKRRKKKSKKEQGEKDKQDVQQENFEESQRIQDQFQEPQSTCRSHETHQFDEFHGNKKEKDLSSSDEEVENQRQNITATYETLKKKSKYTKYDIMDRYHYRRWQIPFLVYKCIDWWPFMDYIAALSHIFNGFIIIYVALYMNVSFFMCIYVFSVVIYYITAISKLQIMANEISQLITLGTQIDILEASRTCKIYNKKSNWQFHKIRHYIWQFQLALLSIIAILSFPTGLVNIWRQRCQYNENASFDYKECDTKQLDDWTYWLFIIGIYQGDTQKEVQQHINAIGILFVGLFLERSAINWLDNRWGCNYFFFQKFVELEMRKKAIDEKWEKQPVPFRPSHYAYHNFYKVKSFELIVQRFFKQSDMQRENLQAKEDHILKLNSSDEFRDFIPPKVGKRLQQIIQFTIRIDGRDPSLFAGGSIDSETEKKLEKLFQDIQLEIDYEQQKKLVYGLELRVREFKENENDKDEKTEKKKELSRSKEDLKWIEKQINNRPELHQDIEETYEQIEVLKQYKIKMLEDILKQAVSMKYKISFSKGMVLVFESVIMLVLMISIALKSNVFSLIYLIFVFRFPFCQSKHQLFARLCFYISISLLIQYLLYTLNMTHLSLPQQFPKAFQGFPFKQIHQNKNYLHSNLFPLPLFFQLKSWIGEKNFLKFCYFTGIGINLSQLENLLLDFFNLYLVSMYILYFRNPIFDKEIKKVFWMMPLPSHDPKLWNRLDESTKKKKLFSLNPGNNKKVKEMEQDHNISKKEKQLYQKRIEYLEKNQKKFFSYDTILVNYIDLKYNQIWSKPQMKKVKKQIKDQCFFYRIVKKGSYVVYLCQHINAIFGILLLSIMRQSLVSIMYIFVIVVGIMFNSEDALKQRSLKILDDIQELQEAIKTKQQDLKKLESQIQKYDKHSNDFFDCEKDIENIRLNIEQMLVELKQNKFNQMQEKQITKIDRYEAQVKNLTEKEREKSANKLELRFKYALQIICILDFTSQIVCQMPMIQYGKTISIFGFRKIWESGKNQEAFNYKDFMNPSGDYKGLSLNPTSFVLQLFNCFMVCYVFLQVAIYDSPGYKKFKKHKDGSLDLLLQLSFMKGKSIAYKFNNKKIMQIIQFKKIQQQVNNNFEELKDKLKNWRKMKKLTLDNGIDQLIGDKVNQKQNEEKEENEIEFMFENIQSPPQMEEPKHALNISKNLRSSILEQPEDSDLSNNSDQNSSYNNFSAQDEPTTIQERQEFLRKCSRLLVDQKVKKISCLVDIYQFLNKNYVDQISFESNKQWIEELLQRHSQGRIDIPTELEIIMEEEAFEFISSQFELKNKNASQQLSKIVSKFKRQEQSTHENIDEYLLSVVKKKINEDSKLRLKDMDRSYEFTRTGSMILRIIESFLFVLISKLQYVIYLCMIFSTYQNAGLITMIYPFMIFGWALLEEARPTPVFWRFLKKWTTVVLFIKFFYIIKWTDIFENAQQNEPNFMHFDLPGLDLAHNAVKKIQNLARPQVYHNQILAYLKLGLYNYKHLREIVFYILPEVIILCLLMLNSIYLRLVGYKTFSELDIEGVTEGIDRVLEKGDLQKVEKNKVKSFNMNLYHYFHSYKHQYLTQQTIQLKELNDEDETNQDEYLNIGDTTMREQKIAFVELNSQTQRIRRQKQDIKRITNGIKLATRHFTLDKIVFQDVDTEKCIERKQLQKTLEEDTLVFSEGFQEDDKDFITQQQSKQDYLNLISLETMSGGDNGVEFYKKSNILKDRNKSEFGMFEQWKYFNRIFPAMKIQKPGYDLYGATNIFLTLLILITFISYNYFNISVVEALPGQDVEGSQFSNGMIVIVLFIIFIMVMERYTNRTATRAPNENQGLEGNEDLIDDERQGYFNAPSLMASKNSLKKKRRVTRWNRNDEFKTDPYKEINLSNQNYLGFLEKLKYSKTRIPIQQKVKYFMHMILLVIIHIYVFWYVPITGNLQLYDTPICNQKKEKFYGCKDFHMNGWLQVYYLILLMYMFLSAMQIKFGLPLIKKSSSVFQYDNNLFFYCLANVYNALPFIVEIRCLIDFSFANTSLDIFQYWEIYQANFDMYNGKNGNIYYFLKPIGAPMAKIDRCLMGFLFSGIVLLILCGPLVLFSPMAGFVAPNPVLYGDLDVSFLITKAISQQEMNKYLTGQENAFEQYDSLNLLSLDDQDNEKKDQKKPKELCKSGKGEQCSKDYYKIYKNHNLQFRTLQKAEQPLTKFNNWTESHFFQPNQIQLCLASEYSQNKWDMSMEKRTELRRQIQNALNDGRDSNHLHLTIQTWFTRQYPPSMKKAYLQQIKTLNTTNYHDCQTKKQLLEFSKTDWCKAHPDKEQYTIKYYEVFNPYLILGDSKKAKSLTRQSYVSKEKEDHLHYLYHDLDLTYHCKMDEWDIMSSLNSTKQSLNRTKAMEVKNQTTCELKDPKLFNEVMQYKKSDGTQVVYSRVSFMIFSMLVSSSFLASYSLTTLYTVVVYALGTQIRVMIIWPSYKAFIWEAVETDAVLRLIDYVHLRRYEEDLTGEEEGYRLLREILHCPEFFKSICGSCLRGTLDPNQDFLSKEDQKKMNQIQALEKKGFEVKNLKDKILEKANVQNEIKQDEKDEGNEKADQKELNDYNYSSKKK